jgi:non-ribosomal peptide synthetase component E (peptide arylation enzyme)
MMSLVPPLISFLAKSPTVTKEHLSSLQMISNGAATCPVSAIQQLNSKLEGGQMQFKDG